MKRPSIPALTSLRFFAALLVVLYHYDIDLKALTPFSTFGYEAVTFFFVLSGFILTYAHVENGELNLTTKTFLWHRFARIAPAYYAGLLVSVPFFLVAFVIRHQISWTTFAMGMVLVPSALQSWVPPAALLWNMPAWSLSVEMFLYVCFSPVISLVKPVGTSRLLLYAYALVVASSLLNLFFMYRYSEGPEAEWWRSFIAYFPLWHLPQFIFGIALGKVLIVSKKVRPGIYNTILLGSLVLLVGLIGADRVTAPYLASNLILAPIFGMIIFGAAGTTLGFLSYPWLVVLGEASYALYILHIPVWLWWYYLVTARISMPVPINLVLYLGVVVGVSILFYKFVERPSRRWLLSAPSRLRAPAGGGT